VMNQKIDLIYADFNNRDSSGRLRLNTNGTLRNLKEKNIRLVRNMTLKVSDGDLIVEGIVGFSNTEDIWVIEIDSQNIKEVE
jgi:hypothetical protein